MSWNRHGTLQEMVIVGITQGPMNCVTIEAYRAVVAIERCVKGE